MPPTSLRIALLQRVCTGYRRDCFSKIADQEGVQLRVFVGEDMPHSKVRNASCLDPLDVVRMKTQWRRYPMQSAMLSHCPSLKEDLRNFGPDVIVTEGESNYFNAKIALKYGKEHSIPVIHWSLGAIPGKKQRRIKHWLSTRFRRQFDGFLVYSTFGAAALSRQGLPAERIGTVLNVGDVERHLQQAGQITQSQQTLRNNLGLKDMPTAIYVGAIDANKRLDVLLDAAKEVPAQILIVGDGPEREPLKAQASSLGIADRVLLPGRITEHLDHWYAAADFLALPGRGGIVISEAMAYGLPVMAYQADGTELDLVDSGTTGWILDDGDVRDIQTVLRQAVEHPEEIRRFGKAARQSIQSVTQDKMVQDWLNHVREIVKLAEKKA